MTEAHKSAIRVLRKIKYFVARRKFQVNFLLFCIILIHFLTLFQMTNFRLFQTERVCRRQFHIWWKWQKVLEMDSKHCRKKRNFSWRAICFKRTCKHVKTMDCLGKGQYSEAKSSLYNTILCFIDHEDNDFWKHCGKMRKCWPGRFFSFPQLVTWSSRIYWGNPFIIKLTIINTIKMVIKIWMQMQAFIDLDWKSRFIKCLHLDWNLSK